MQQVITFPCTLSEKFGEIIEQLIHVDFVADETVLQKLETQWNLIAPNMFMYNYSVSDESEKDKISDAIKKYYFGNETVSKKNTRQLIQVRLVDLWRKDTHTYFSFIQIICLVFRNFNR